MEGLTSSAGWSGSRRKGEHSVAVVLLWTLLTCCVRCVEPRSKLSNIVLIVADDQDALLGGMVSRTLLYGNKLHHDADLRQVTVLGFILPHFILNSKQR